MAGRCRFPARAVFALMVASMLLSIGSAWAGGSGDSGSDPGGGIPDVVGGHAVTPDDWSDTAGVVYGSGVDCTGVLVAPDVVLTAAHCIGGITQVYLETWDLTQPPGEAINVVQQISYPNWMQAYDLGLLLLEQPSSVEPRLIAHGCATDFIVDDADVTVVGWGAIDTWGNTSTTDLMEGHTTIDDADCSELANGCIAAVSPGGELGAGGEGVDSCFGDSGGPLYLHTPIGDLLVGITSRAYATSTVPCGDGGIYVRPDAVIDWIETEAGITLPQPDCGALIFGDDFETGGTGEWSAVVS